MIVLDTNVVSEMSKPYPNTRVLSWVNRQPQELLYLTAVSVAELQEGLLLLPEGKRKGLLRSLMENITDGFVNPVLVFDREAGYKYAELVIKAKANRYTLPIADGYIASIAAIHGFAVATRDIEPFRAAGVPVINPWEE
jgi:predicted nucleic acid-binding protein